jgi:internalin A
LSNLINLERLGLSRNNIVDITPLSKLINLRDLFLCDNRIKDLSPLAKLTELTYLDLSNNNEVVDYTLVESLIIDIKAKKGNLFL